MTRSARTIQQRLDFSCEHGARLGVVHMRLEHDASLLIDEQGRIMFKPHVHDAETRGVLAREVEALLNRRR